jgi:hypothetical protein
LTISFHASPYFTGADIVFFFAWLPFIITGGGTKLSADAWIANRVAKNQGLASPELVAIPFASVQNICGHYREGACAARKGLACDKTVCPVLLAGRAPLVSRVSIDSVDRRAVVVGGTVAAGVGAAALIFGGAVAEAGRMIGGAKSAKNATTHLTVPTWFIHDDRARDGTDHTDSEGHAARERGQGRAEGTRRRVHHSRRRAIRAS